ncbi:MAG: hypothetical protein ACXWKG_08050 [Limisphaerales bacterium]
MKVDQAVNLIKNCAERMNSMYGKTVFDEWVVLSFVAGKATIVRYMGPRQEGFEKNFGRDAGELRPTLMRQDHGPGDFEFARYGNGTHFEAMMVVGAQLYLICNNTANSMDGITKDSRWLSAQVPFLELTETFRKDPLAI